VLDWHSSQGVTRYPRPDETLIRVAPPSLVFTAVLKSIPTCRSTATRQGRRVTGALYRKEEAQMCQYYKNHLFASFPNVFYLMSPPIFRASCKDDAEQLRRLIEQGADVNARSRDGLTPLIMASLKGKTTVVKLLVEYGADVNAQDNNGWTPLAYALDRSTVSAFVTRLKYKFRSMSSDQAVFMHYSFLAPKFDNTIAKLLISNGADVTHVWALDMTPLLSAVFSGNVEIVELLLTKGANVNENDSDGYSPLMCAAMRGYSTIVKLFAYSDDSGQ
jgi:hypothetical protein